MLLVPFSCSDAVALNSELMAAFERELTWIVAQSPPYTWGGSVSEEKGLDCSGLIYLAARRAGIPGVMRTQSYRMAIGADGWSGYDLVYNDAGHCDMVFWTYTPDRPTGHVGALLHRHGSQMVAHASSSKRRAVMHKHQHTPTVTKYRRLNHGETMTGKPKMIPLEPGVVQRR